MHVCTAIVVADWALGTLGLGGDRREAPRAPAIPLPVDHSIPEKGLYQPRGKGLKHPKKSGCKSCAGLVHHFRALCAYCDQWFAPLALSLIEESIE